MSKDWIMVRVARSTHARLDAVRRSMLLAADVGLRTLEVDDRDRVSLDQVIGLLIDMRDKHAERRRKSARIKTVKINQVNLPQNREEVSSGEEQCRSAEDVSSEAQATA